MQHSQRPGDRGDCGSLAGTPAAKEGCGRALQHERTGTHGDGLRARVPYAHAYVYACAHVGYHAADARLVEARPYAHACALAYAHVCRYCAPSGNVQV